MTGRKHIKKQHRLQQDEQRRALERSRTQRRLLGFAAGALVLAAVAAAAFAFAPWSGSSGEADADLPTLDLSIGDNFFQPDTLTVQAGQKYRLNLVNTGLNTHDIWGAGSDGQTSTGDDYRSKPIPGGGSASVKIKYDKPGTYYFVCTFHAGQGGTFIVQ